MSKASATVRLGEVLTQVWRDEPTNSAKSYRLLGARWYAQGLFIKDVKSGHEIRADRLYRVLQGDFVYNRLFAWKGSFALACAADDGCYVSNEFPCFEIDGSRLDGSFLRLYFARESVWTEALGLSAGGTPTSRNRLNESRFLGMEIPLPPLAEQRRLAARIETLAGKFQEARRIRDSAAGEVPAIAAAYLNRLFGNPYESIAGTLFVKKWAKVDEVVEDVADGPHVTPSYVEQGVPFITAQNITSGRIRFDNHKAITPEDHILFQRRAKAQRGDVLITKDGTIGMPCFVDTDREFSFFVSVALIKPKRTILDGEFLVWVFRIPYMQKRIAAKSRGDMIRHLVLREIRDLTIPVPSLAEQRRIVAELDALQAQVDALKRLQSETITELDALLPSVLDRAFKGELV